MRITFFLFGVSAVACGDSEGGRGMRSHSLRGGLVRCVASRLDHWKCEEDGWPFEIGIRSITSRLRSK